MDPPASQVGANESWVQPFADGRGADRAVFMLIGGAIGTNDVVLQLWQTTDSPGTSAKVITGATATIPYRIARAHWQPSKLAQVLWTI